MKYCFFILSLLYANIILSQDVNYIRVYHRPILEAEEYILQEKFDSALICYQKAFKQVPYVFCYDYVNAAYIAHKAGDNKTARVYLDSAVIKGAAININRTKIYFDDKKEWYNFKKHRYNKLQDVGKARWNDKMIAEVNSLYKQDQKYRTLSTRSTKNVSYKVKRMHDSIVAVKTKKLLKSGKLTENSVGFKSFGLISVIIYHALREDTAFMYECYKKGYFEKRDYYYAICRNSLQFNKESKYITLTENPEFIKRADSLRNVDGIISQNKLKYLKKIEKKSRGLFFTY